MKKDTPKKAAKLRSVFDEFLKHSHFVEARANQLTQDMIKTLKGSRADIIGKLAALEADILKKPFNEDILSRRQSLLKAQRSAIDKLIKEVYLEMGVNLKTAAQDTLEGSAARTFTILDPIAGATQGAKLAFKEMSLPIVKTWFETATVDGLLPNEMLKKLETATADRITALARKAMVEGQAMETMARAIRKQGIEGTFAGIEGISQTLLQSASNYSKDQIIKEHFSDLVTGWEYVTTLDGRTCLVCGANDGQKYKLNDIKPILPRHFRCRCTYVPTTPTYKELGIDMDEITTGQRPTVKHTEKWVNHRDGTRSRTFTPAQGESFKGTYQQWLKGQLVKDPAFVREVLGEKRFELFRAGKLNLKSMVSDGRVRSLKELGK